MATFPGYSQGAGTPLSAVVDVSVGATVVELDTPEHANFVVLSVEAQAVRYRDDGTDPTASHGVLIPVTTIEPWVYASATGLAALKFIAVTGTAKINAVFYR